MGSPPQADSPTYHVSSNSPFNQPAPGVLSGDTLNGATITSYGATGIGSETTLGPATPTRPHGTVVLNGDGSFTYTPPSGGLMVNDSFRYTLTNATPPPSTAIVSLVPGSPPVAVANSYTAFINTTLTVTAAAGVFSGDTLNGAMLVSYGINGSEQMTVGQPAATALGGSVTIFADGSFAYTPPDAFTASDSFVYLVENPAGGSSATVTLTAPQLILPLVALGGSDCLNSNVTTSRGAIGGNVGLVLCANGTVDVTVFMTAGTANTTYQLNLKCVRPLGTFLTGSGGTGQGCFTFQQSEVSGSLFCFDMYPPGTQPWSPNMYQSIQGNKASLYTSSGQRPRGRP
jgi:hypothetical protein